MNTVAALLVVTCLRILPGLGHIDGTQDWRADQWPSWRDGSARWELRMLGARRTDEPWVVRVPVAAPADVLWPIGPFGALVVQRDGSLLIQQQRQGDPMPDACAWPSWRLFLPVQG